MAALLVGPGQPHPRPHDRRVDLEKRVADRTNKGKVALPIAAIEIIEKNPASAAPLVAMFEKKIFVAPFLKPRVAFGIVIIAGMAESRVKGIFRRRVRIDRG